MLKAARTGEPTDVPPGLIGRQVGSDVLVAAQDEWVRVRRIQAGSSSFPAADVLREGDRFALPAWSEEPSLR